MNTGLSSEGTGSVTVEHNFLPSPLHTQAQVLANPDPQVKAEVAAGIAAHSLGAPELKKELAQLLAASISQAQMHPLASTRSGAEPAAAAPPPGTPTNAELASLAAIMAGTQSVRKPLPRFRDELATLNYNRPNGQTSPRDLPQSTPDKATDPVPAPLAPPSRLTPGSHAPSSHAGSHVTGAATLEPHHDDEPMPIPSTWREKTQDEDDRPLARQLGAAAMGLAAGLVVVVPAVLWLVGIIGPQAGRTDSAYSSSRASDRAPIKIRPIEPPTESATFYSNETPGSPAAEPGAVTTASMARANPIDPTQAIEQVLVMARQKIDGGDVAGARDILAGEDTASPAIAFALAETFDPNMLAAWGSRGISADVQRARALYTRALDMGYGRAMARLDALQ